MVAMVAHAQRGRRIHRFKVHFSCRTSSKLALAMTSLCVHMWWERLYRSNALLLLNHLLVQCLLFQSHIGQASPKLYLLLRMT